MQMTSRFGTPLFASTEVGSRIATRVRIIREPSAYHGRVGMVVRIHHPGSVLVRLGNIDIPFGVSEFVACK